MRSLGLNALSQPWSGGSNNEAISGVPLAKSPTSRAISLGNGTYILAYGVAKGTLVGRGYLLNWREDGKEESDKEERGALLRDVYIILASPRAYDPS